MHKGEGKMKWRFCGNGLNHNYGNAHGQTKEVGLYYCIGKDRVIRLHDKQ